MTIEEMDQIAADISVFADVGTDPPAVETSNGGFTLSYFRAGDFTQVEYQVGSNAITESYGDEKVKHAGMKAMLASVRYGNLREWADKQHAYFKQSKAGVSKRLTVKGTIDDRIGKQGVDEVDDRLSYDQVQGSTRVLLIDGPAGIGKTEFITSLASKRAEKYSTLRRPLILHVQSRGRTLSFLTDLMAYSLQRLRLDVTFDQVPILSKYGLVTIAIDGFDELADPDGYDLAWSQVSDLIAGLRGLGSIILSGRETFIGRERVLKDIKSLREDTDEVSVLTLDPPTKTEAMQWLKSQGWSASQLDSIEDFLEPSSLALRPFFLGTLVDTQSGNALATSQSNSILSILSDAMVEREVEKFGETVDRILTPEQRRNFLYDLMGEVARDMAESGSASISDAMLSWLVEVVMPDNIPEERTRYMKGRAQVIAFLTNDDRKGFRKFYHEKFYEFFLSRVLIYTIGKGETGKLLARSLFGSSFLETFGEVISSAVRTKEVQSFIQQAMHLLRTTAPVDRTRKNIALLLIAALSVNSISAEVEISSVELEECRFTGTAVPAKFNSVTINQFDCRGGDLSAISFTDTVILTLIADDNTRLPSSFPDPQRVQDITLGRRAYTEPVPIRDWIRGHLKDQPKNDDGLVPDHLRTHDALRVLQKACRLRQYWLRRGDDVYASRLLDDQNWAIVESALLKNGLLRVEDRQASGTDARFLHVRQAQDILAENRDDDNVRGLYRDLADALLS